MSFAIVLATAGTVAADDLAVDANDPQAIRWAADALTQIRSRPADLATAAAQLANARAHLVLPDARQHPNHARLWAAYGKAKTAFLAAAGKSAGDHIADDARTPAADLTVVNVVLTATSACPTDIFQSRTYQVPSERATMREQLDKAIARAKRGDPRALRFYGAIDSHSGSIDVPYRLAYCEAYFATLAWLAEDQRAYAEDARSGKILAGCGKRGYSFEALKLGSGWGAWQRPGRSHGTHIADCKFPKARKQPDARLRGALNTEFPETKGASVYELSSDTTERRGRETYRMVHVLVYHKKLTGLDAGGSPCGSGKDLACEAAGSKTAAAYNSIRHATRRAAVHRKAGRAEHCRQFLAGAYQEHEQWAETYKQLKASGEWASGVRYQTQLDGIVDEKTILAAVADMGRKADERALNGWCDGKGAEDPAWR